jgi:hypothetical protein
MYLLESLSVFELAIFSLRRSSSAGGGSLDRAADPLAHYTPILPENPQSCFEKKTLGP